MKRRLLKLGLLLLAGAIINVAVAWGCAWNTPAYLGLNMGLSRPSLPFAIAASHFASAGYDVTVSDDSGVYLPNEQQHLGAMLISVQGGCRELKSGKQLEPVVLGYFGWPVRSMRVEVWDSFSGIRFVGGFQRMSPRAPLVPDQHGQSVYTLPLLSIWPGFAIDTIFYAAIVWLLLFAPFQLSRWWAARRIRRGLCPACAYPVGTSDKCTECGKQVTPRSVETAT